MTNDHACTACYDGGVRMLGATHAVTEHHAKVIGCHLGSVPSKVPTRLLRARVLRVSGGQKQL